MNRKTNVITNIIKIILSVFIPIFSFIPVFKTSFQVPGLDTGNIVTHTGVFSVFEVVMDEVSILAPVFLIALCFFSLAFSVISLIKKSSGFLFVISTVLFVIALFLFILFVITTCVNAPRF